MNSATASELTTSAVIRQRLVGLAVLLVAVFLLSMLLRGLGGPRAADEEGLQTVVVPLGTGSDLPVASATLPEEPPSTEPAVRDPGVPSDTAPVAVPEAVEPAPAPSRTAAAPSAEPRREPAEAGRVAKPAPAPAPPRWYVALGSFGDAANAKALVLRARQAGMPAESQPQRTSNGLRVRVRAGPFKNEREAQAARATLIVEGMTGARLVKEP